MLVGSDFSTLLLDFNIVTTKYEEIIAIKTKRRILIFFSTKIIISSEPIKLAKWNDFRTNCNR